MAVEAEQRAWDEQGEDHNHEVFPLILDLRDVLRDNGVPLRPERASGCTPCGMAAPSHHAAAGAGAPGATGHAGPAPSAGPAVEGAGRSE
jgi:hypothetical protein